MSFFILVSNVNKTVKMRNGDSYGDSMGTQIEKQNVLDGDSMGIQIVCFLRLSFCLKYMKI